MPFKLNPPLYLAFQSHPWSRKCAFYLVEHREVSDHAWPQPFLLDAGNSHSETAVWRRQKEGFSPELPSFSLEREQAQDLFDSMWTSGFRPTEQINEAAKIAATERHLADMRAIVFDKLKITPPQENNRGR